MLKRPPNIKEPAHHEIAACAQAIWEAEGRPRDRDVIHWFQARAQLIATRNADAGLLKILESKKSKPAKLVAKLPKSQQSLQLAKVA